LDIATFVARNQLTIARQQKLLVSSVVAVAYTILDLPLLRLIPGQQIKLTAPAGKQNDQQLKSLKISSS
jgi:hypothetical protein